MSRLILLPLLLAFALPATSGPFQRAAQVNDRLIAEALAGMGVSPDAPALRGAVPRAFQEIYPRERYDRFRLSRTQARAVAYIAMIVALESPHLVGPPPPVAYCVDLTEASFELSAAIPSQGGLFLTTAEKNTLRRASADIRRIAAQCGCFDVAEKALELNDFASQNMPDRRVVTQSIAELRRLAAHCG